MKAGIWFILISIITGFPLQAQDINKMIFDTTKNKEIMIGYCDRGGLQQGVFGESYIYEYDAYTPLPKTTRKIKRKKKDYTIILILASWCHDSQEQVPRFYRILDEAKIPDEIMQVICVNGEKKCKEIRIDEYGIDRVPTFIFYREGKEIGRIVETPEKSLEEDMLEIIIRR